MKGSASSTSEVDPRHGIIRSLIQRLFVERFHFKCQWDGSEAKSLSRLLAANPSWTAEQLSAMVKNRFASDALTSERPRLWLANLDKYAGAPVDRFDRAKPVSGSASVLQRQEPKPVYLHEKLQRAGMLTGTEAHDAQ